MPTFYLDDVHIKVGTENSIFPFFQAVYSTAYPHKPRVTLLLTQIDKYVDLEQYEFDPKVYVSHHLPLIAHNFPNLDVYAVAALGAADSTFGINSILVRCLFSTPFVQDAINHVKECRRTKHIEPFRLQP